jgi:TonB family protein
MLVLLLALQATTFQPAALSHYVVDPIPYGTGAAGIVLLDVAVDERGASGDARVLKDVAPFTDLIRKRLADWRFEPAREDGKPLASRVLVAGIYRPAMLEFPAPPDGPSLPKADRESGAPVPTSVAIAPYPPNAMGDASVMVEVQLDAQGQVVDARVVGGTPGFDGAAAGAARQWKFSPASRKGAAVPSRAYLLFSFRQPF